MMQLFLIIPLLICSSIVALNFFSYLLSNRFISRPTIFRPIELWTVFFAPLFFLVEFDLGKPNDCCSDSAVFAPGNRTGIYFFIILCILTYFYSTSRKSVATPVAELLINSILTLGVVLNVMIAVHIYSQDFGGFLCVFGSIPIIMLFILSIDKNRKLVESNLPLAEVNQSNALIAFCIRILKAAAWIRFPILTILAFPLLLLATLFLYLFGQKPDSLISAFTDTYKHGFSQLDYMCDNVQCGGHFLCSVAAKGHSGIVQPVRYGERNGGEIICNRQLLVANAFEELIQSRLPFVHKIVRRNYNKVGSLIHRHYHVFDNRFVADVIYIFMKPFEWMFLLVLYSCDCRPENRIARQYLSRDDQAKIKERYL